MNEPVIKLPVDEILARFDHGSRWIQGAWVNDQGECLHSGIRACMPRKGDAFLIEQVGRKYGWGTTWNDAPGRTFDDVQQMIVKHREVMPDEMLGTFGPQWAQVAELVRRVADMSVAEVEAAAWPAGDSVDRHAAEAAAAAWSAAASTTWSAARDAAQAAAWPAAGSAARSAAGYAALALSTRHLVNTDEYTRQHYNLLVGPLAAVIGPVHPDDKPQD